MSAVQIVDEAEAQARAIDAWWTENRRAAPSLFARELANAVALLGAAPGAGERFRRSAIPGVRRLVLPRTRNVLYYVHDHKNDIVYILAIWGGPRGNDPTLKDPR